MAKNPTAKTNGHTVDTLKPVTPKKRASKVVLQPSVQAAEKSATRPATRAVAKPAAKPAARAAVKVPVKAAVRKPAAKPAAKPAVKVAAKPAATPAPRTRSAARASSSPGAQAAAPEERVDEVAVTSDKVRKPKLVRDSFTMPEQEYALLGQVKKACIKAGFEIKKSELLRIGVALISQLDTATLQSVLAGLPQLKTGRPKNE